MAQLGTLVAKVFCYPGSTPSGVEIFLHVEFKKKSSYHENRGAHLNFVKILA